LKPHHPHINEMNALSSYVWRQDKHVNPAVVAVMDQYVPKSDRAWRSCHPYWVVDCGHYEDTLYRIPRLINGFKMRSINSLHVYTPNTVFWEDMTSFGDANFRSTYVLFRGGEYTPLAQRASGTPGHFSVYDPDRVGIQILEQMAQMAQQRGQEGLAEIQAGLWRLINELCSAKLISPLHYVIGKEDSHFKYSEFVGRVHDYFRQHLHERLVLEDVALALDVSLSTLSHSYRQDTGESPMVSLNKMRIEVAKVMLLKGHRLQVIAQQTGFGDAFHFSRSFKRIEGCSPRAYRQQSV